MQSSSAVAQSEAQSPIEIPATNTRPPPTIDARCFSIKEGMSVYARAILEEFGKSVSLHFISQATPFDEYKWSEKQQDPNASEDNLLFDGVVFGTDPDFPQKNRVEEILINLTLPLPADTNADLKWLGLANSIGTVCKTIFPNFKAQNSCLIVHRGFQRIHVDEALL